jgi:signal transduction histidine kinase
MLFFAISVAAIVGFIYLNTTNILQKQYDETIRAEVQGLAEQYQQRGLAGLYDIISKRVESNQGTLYALIDAQGSIVAGNLKKAPDYQIENEAWTEFAVVYPAAEGGNTHVVRAYHVDLKNGYELLVGNDVNELKKFQLLMKETLYGALFLAVLLGLGGGYFVSNNFLRRIDAITKSSKKIMAGDLTGRMPIAGSNDELDQLSISLNEMLSQIERLMQGMKEVSSNVAHDLRTPLTRMRARVEAALRHDSVKEHRDALNQTIEECDGLLRTFNALLSIAKSEAGQASQKFENLDLQEILLDIGELYEPLVEDAGGTFKSKIETGLNVSGDRQLLSQAVSNLLENAIKYGAGEITLLGQVIEQQVLVSVADQGPGIPNEDRERVLMRFVRLDESRSKPGNGLGLSLVASVMTLHGGKLILEGNEPGLRAVLRLPLQKKLKFSDGKSFTRRLKLNESG